MTDALPVVVQRATPGFLRDHIAGVRDVYRTAFAEGNALEAQRWIHGAFLHHLRRDGFGAMVAVSEHDRVVGFAYGFRYRRDGWFGSHVDPALRAAGLREWGEDAFEFVELAVLPGYRRRGIAGQMHDRLLSAARHRTALLTTETDNSAARAMYERRGWIVLLEDFRFSSSQTATAVVMGRRLDG